MIVDFTNKEFHRPKFKKGRECHIFYIYDPIQLNGSEISSSDWNKLKTGTITPTICSVQKLKVSNVLPTSANIAQNVLFFLSICQNFAEIWSRKLSKCISFVSHWQPSCLLIVNMISFCNVMSLSFTEQEFCWLKLENEEKIILVLITFI